MKSAVVLLSGGLDSATVLAMAVAEGYRCHALSVRYGQRHSAELDAASHLAHSLGAVAHKVVDVDLRSIGGSALTDPAIDVPVDGVNPGLIPSTYVPARNTIMLALALGYAETLDALDIFYGANAVDFSGYPDCRPEFVAAFERLANLATKAGVEGRTIRVHAPIVSMTKAEIIRAGAALGVDFSRTVSCYRATPDGRACGVCDACRIRRAGFEAAGTPDPTRYAVRDPG
jgi:7-cyano-7-deazaguanine synthase